MSIKTQKAIMAAIQSLNKDVEQLVANDARQDKILDVQGREIADFQQQMMEMRNRAIAAEARARVPYKDISTRYGISEGRISQIKKEYM